MSTKQTEALKLALDWLEWFHKGSSIDAKASSTQVRDAIREALAEQPEPVAEPGRNHWEDGDVFERISAMKKQPAQQEPVAVARVDDLERGGRVRALAMGLGLDAPLYTSPPAQQEPVSLPEKIYEFVPTPEPAKWHHPECEGECIACLIERVVQEAYGSQGLGYLQRHLTSPPSRRPLTDEEIWDEVKAADLDWQTGWSLDEDASNRYITFARAIEAAHGIKENT